MFPQGLWVVVFGSEHLIYSKIIRIFAPKDYNEYKLWIFLTISSKEIRLIPAGYPHIDKLRS